MRIIVYKIKEILEIFKEISISPLYVEQELQQEVDDFDVLFMPTDPISLAYAKELRIAKPKLNIIFISDDAELCYLTMQMHASGFLLQPVTKEMIQNELENVRYGVYSRIFIRCFGTFDIVVDGVSIPFKRRKCKELLAYLVCHNGKTVSMNELCKVLFNEVSNKKITYLYVLKSEIMRTLKSYGLEEAIKYQNNGFIIDLKQVDCDYFQYLEGKKTLYHGKFMSEYKWAKKIIENQKEKI